MAARLADRDHSPRASRATAAGRGAALAAHTDSAARPRIAGPARTRDAIRLASAGRLPGRQRALRGGAHAGSLRTCRDAAHRRRHGPRDFGAALAGAAAVADHPRSGGILGQQLCRRAQGDEGPLSEARLARKPARGRPDAWDRAPQTAKVVTAGLTVVSGNARCAFCVSDTAP